MDINSSIHSETAEPFFIYINDVPCKIDARESQRVGPDSCLIIPRLFLNGGGCGGGAPATRAYTGEILLRDVTGDIYNDVAAATNGCQGEGEGGEEGGRRRLSVAEEALKLTIARGGYLLLPDPVTGFVRVERYHFYQTVRFVGGGEHLVLSGKFEQHDGGVVAVPPTMTMSDADTINSLLLANSLGGGGGGGASSDDALGKEYPNTMANEMLGFALFLSERAGGSTSVQSVTGEWHALPHGKKKQYCEDALAATGIDLALRGSAPSQ